MVSEQNGGGVGRVVATSVVVRPCDSSATSNLYPYLHLRLSVRSEKILVWYEEDKKKKVARVLIEAMSVTQHEWTIFIWCFNLRSQYCVSGCQGSCGSQSTSRQLRPANDSLSGRSPNNSEIKQDNGNEETTDAGIYAEVYDSEEVTKKYGKMEIGEVRSRIDKVTSYENPFDNVLTLEEVKRKMKEKELSKEEFRSEAVENELQRLLTFFERK